MDKFNFDESFSIDDPIADDSVFINMDEISLNADNDSKFMLKDLVKIYGNEKFINEHPDYHKRLEVELESIRMLLKMRRSSEITHDILVKQIGMNPGNASLYNALNKMQKSLLDIQTKLDETVKNINGLLKNYQLEIPFEETNDETQEGGKINKDSFRGSKAFILEISKELEN